MVDPIRAAAERLLESGTPYAGQLLKQAESDLRAALSTEPPAPAEVREAFAELEQRQENLHRFRDLRVALAWEPPAPAEPDTDAVLTLAAIIRQAAGNGLPGAARLAELILSHPNVARVFQPPAPAPAADPLLGFAATLAASQRPMDPHVAVALTPEARWEMYDGERAPAADHFPGVKEMVPAADGEREELAALINQAALGWEPEACLLGNMTASQLARASALLRQPGPAPVPVPVAERPWERPGWCDAEGFLWLWDSDRRWVHQTGTAGACNTWTGSFALPHWAIAIPQPPQANTTHPTPTEPPTND